MNFVIVEIKLVAVFIANLDNECLSEAYAAKVYAGSRCFRSCRRRIPSLQINARRSKSQLLVLFLGFASIFWLFAYINKELVVSSFLWDKRDVVCTVVCDDAVRKGPVPF